MKLLARRLPSGVLLFLMLAGIAFVAFWTPEAWAQEAAGQVEYRTFPVVGSRVIVWVIAQLHLMFGAFVLAVPMFALTIEFIGFRNGDKRYDDLAYEFTRLLSVSFSFTASLGALLTFFLFILYPRLMEYLVSIFDWTFMLYAAVFFLEAVFLYSYYYGWGKMPKWLHLVIGLCLNLVGVAIIFDRVSQAYGRRLQKHQEVVHGH